MLDLLKKKTTLKYILYFKVSEDRNKLKNKFKFIKSLLLF